jgi:hypothetical protein
MNFRRAVFLTWGLLLLLFGLAGWPLSAAPATDSLMRVHWLGLKQVGADTNAAQLMEVWQLPQTTALVAQTLDKLSRCPGHGAANTASALLRPLFDDLISSEFYLEVSAPTNSQLSTVNYQLSLALRLPADRARLWQTNLTAVSATLTSPTAPQRIECSRAGDWTLVGVGLDKKISRTEFAARLVQKHARSAAKTWLEADFNLLRLASCFPTINYQLSTISSLYLTLSGDAGDVHTFATLNFSRSLKTPLLPWEIPTNFICAPLDSFTAVRGIAPWLTGLTAWQKLQFTPAPDQAYLWAQTGTPYQTYFTAPLPAASNQLSHLAGRLVQNANPWLVTNADGYFQWHTNLPGVVWHLFIISPFLKPAVINQHDCLLGGLFPLTEGNTNLPPSEILRAILGTPDLVYYQAEHTGLRIDDDLFISQLFRAIFQKAPLSPAAAATLWLKNAGPLLGDSATAVTRTGPRQLTLARNSSVGLTALELNLLADWLESPQFPCGLHTFSVPPGKKH